jgi:RHS repeat-associated protein
MQYHAPSGLYLTKYRAYDPKDGRWLSRDPIEEAGGLNLYGYVGSQPTKFTDPSGLVKWSGEVYSAALVPGVGGAVYWFDLKSECVDGRYAYIRVRAWGFGAGFGARLTGGASGLTFDDGETDINPDGFEGTFRVMGANAGAILVGGWTLYQLGSNFSDVGAAPSPGLGIDLSVAAVRGKSRVTSVEWKKCNCD